MARPSATLTLCTSCLTLTDMPDSNQTGEIGAVVIDAAHLDRQRQWSTDTFGPGLRLGVLDHIEKEMGEVREDPTDLGEWVDLIILAFDGAWRAGHEPQAILDAIAAKQARNEAREWPDWRTQDTGRAIEHVPESLLMAVRKVVQPGGGLDKPRDLSAREVNEELHRRWPGAFAGCTVIDVADEMRRFYR